MCELCTEAADVAGGRRRKLWELDARLHCSVVGTCLSLGDLRRIERRLKIDPPKPLAEFAIHGNFVVWAGQAGPVARQMHKLLDRRYAAAVRRFAGASGDMELANLWGTSLTDGDIPGPYWALLTHGQASESLVMRAFGHVLMLSHLMGAANRAHIRRLMKIEDERDVLADALAAAKRRLAEREREVSRLLDQHAAEIRQLPGRLSVAQSVEQRLHQAEDRLRSLEGGEAHRALIADLERTTERLAAAKGLLEQTQGMLTSLSRDNAVLAQARQRMEEVVGAVAAECEAMERILRQNLAPASATDAGSADHKDASIDLGGRRIVCVGGRGSTIPHLRALVERFGGEFFHHDGGLAEQTSRLDGLLSRGDIVFCPTTASATMRACGPSAFVVGAPPRSCRCAPTACPPSSKGCAGSMRPR